MPPRSDFPIGIHHYIDYLNANVNQLNLYNIPHSRHQTSGDSEPGSPASSHSGDRTAPTALIPVNSGADVEHDQSFSNSPFPDQDPRVPAQSDNPATGVNSTFLSTTSQPRPTSASEGEEHGYTASPTESVHSDQSASLSAYSGYSSGHSAQSGSSDGHYDPDTTQRLPTHPQLYQHQDDHGPGLNIEYRTPALGARPQHYYRMSEDGYQGVLAPEVLDADADIPGVSSQSSSPGSRGSPTLYTIASSSTSSTPAMVQRHLPWQSIHSPPSTEAEQYLRHQMSLPRDKPVNLWALKDPPNRGKPSQPYPELIKLAIFGSPNKKLTLQEIYKALTDRFEWFKDNSGEMAWKNSIRHNLSLNKVFVNIPRPITEPGKGSYWRLDLSHGEGYKRPRIRKSRAQQREAEAAQQQQIAQQRVVGARAAPPPRSARSGEVSPRTASSSAHSLATTSSIDDANIDPQLRDHGHRVGERRVRSTRRTDVAAPYPLGKTPSPVLSLVSSRAQQREPQQTMSEPLATGYSSSSGSASPSPLQQQNLRSREQGYQTAETPSPYLLQNTPSPVLGLVGSSFHQQEQQPYVSEQLATGHSSGLRSASSSPQQNTGPRDQGHRVGERRVRPTTRRTETSSPYMLRKTPSPVRPLVGSRLQRDLQQNISESLAYGHLPDSRSRPPSPLQNPQSRDQGRRVGEGRVHPATRRADTNSSYPLHQTPSPVLPLHLQRELLPEVSEHHSSDSRSGLLSPLQMPRDLLVELSAPVAQPQYGQPAMGQPPPGHSYFVEPSFMPPFGQPSLPPPTLDQSWMPSSTASPSFNAHGHLSLSSSTLRDSPDRGLDKSGIEYITDHGLPRVRRVNGTTSRPASLSPPVGNDGSCQYDTRASTDGTYYDNDGSGHTWNK